MDNIIYIVLVVLAVVFFVSQGYSRKKSRDRKSRKFMEDYQKKDSKPKD